MTLDLWISGSPPPSAPPGVGPSAPSSLGAPGVGPLTHWGQAHQLRVARCRCRRGSRASVISPRGKYSVWACMFPTKTSPGSAQLPRCTMGTRLRWCYGVLRAYGGGGGGSPFSSSKSQVPNSGWDCDSCEISCLLSLAHTSVEPHYSVRCL